MVASHLNRQIILLLKRPLTHDWTSPLGWESYIEYIAFQFSQPSLSFTKEFHYL